MNTFIDSLAEAKIGEELALGYLKRHEWQTEDLREEKYYQDRDIDFFISKGLQSGYVEIKYDSRIGGASGKPPTNNLFIEFISCTARNKKKLLP